MAHEVNGQQGGFIEGLNALANIADLAVIGFSRNRPAAAQRRQVRADRATAEAKTKQESIQAQIEASAGRIKNFRDLVGRDPRVAESQQFQNLVKMEAATLSHLRGQPELAGQISGTVMAQGLRLTEREQKVLNVEAEGAIRQPENFPGGVLPAGVLTPEQIQEEGGFGLKEAARLFAGSDRGDAMLALSDVAETLRAGEEPTERQLDLAAAAGQFLNAVRTFTDAEGNVRILPPLGVPERLQFAAPAGAAAPPTPGPQTTQAAPQGAGGRAPILVPAPEDTTGKVVMRTLTDIADVMDEMRETQDTIGGVVGTAKALFGGVARQAGIPVSANNRRLKGLFERLKLQVAPLLIPGESKLSNQERDRLDSIVGGVSIFDDEDALMIALADLVGFLEEKGLLEELGVAP